MVVQAANLNIEPVELEAIDGSDRELAISPPWTPVGQLADAMERIGLQSPLAIAPLPGGAHRIVCGFRRYEAARQLGWRQVLCRSIASAPASELFQIQLWDTLGGRSLSVLEKARTVERLTTLGGVADEEIVTRYLPLLGERSDHARLARLRELASLPDPLQKAIDEGLDVEAGLLMHRWPASERDFVIEHAQAAGCGRNVQRLLAELVRDLRKAEKATAQQLWAACGGSSPEQLRLQPGGIRDTIERLRQRRYPRLSRHRHKRAELVDQLNLPSGARVETPPYFEGDRITVHIEANDADQLRSAARRLAESGPPLEELFALL